MPINVQQIETLVMSLWPGINDFRIEPLAGGVSADSFVIELSAPCSERWILRCPKGQDAEKHVKRDLAILKAVSSSQLPAPKPDFSESVAKLLSVPGYLYPMLPGRPEYSADQLQPRLQSMAQQLATIHATELTDSLICNVPNIVATLQPWLAWQPEEPDIDLLESELRSELVRCWPSMSASPAVLLHGDFWPGNILWQGDCLSGVVDWEDACIGSPLFDLAIVRLDLCWIIDEQAAAQFTEYYQQLTARKLDALCQWDLLAALRPCQQLTTWAAQWPELGRTDLTYTAMREVQNRFARQALQRVKQLC